MTEFKTGDIVRRKLSMFNYHPPAFEHIANYWFNLHVQAVQGDDPLKVLLTQRRVEKYRHNDPCGRDVVIVQDMRR
jgi:hypothetical protein